MRKIKVEYPKVRAYIKKKYPEVSDGEITKLFCNVPPNTPEAAVMLILKACEKSAIKKIKENEVSEK